jgi:hypothetical protein
MNAILGLTPYQGALKVLGRDPWTERVVLILVTQLVMLLMSSLVLPADGLSAATVWTQLPLLHVSLALLYALTMIALWHAPLYDWLLLVSGWARRAAFLWAALPPVAMIVVEKIAFNSSHIASLLQYRLFGGLAQAFAVTPSSGAPIDPLVAQLTPGRFFATPGCSYSQQCGCAARADRSDCSNAGHRLWWCESKRLRRSSVDV